MDAQPRGIIGIAALPVGTGVRPGTAKEPVAARRGAIIAQPSKAGQLLAGLPFIRRRQLVIFEISQGLAVDFLGYLSERRAGRVGVSPGQVQDRIRELGLGIVLFLLIEF